MADPTSQYITEIVADSDLNVALQNFSAVCAANSVALGLNPAGLTEIAGAATGFTTNLNSWVGARSAANLAKDNKDAQKKASKIIVSKWAKTFRANPAVPDALLDQLDLPRHKTPGTKTPPTTPLDLVATPDVQALVGLRWKRNGNNGTTQFVVEAQTAPDGDWSIVGTTLKVRFSHQAELGMYVAYRVTATRDGLDSQPTVPVVLWPNGQQAQQLALAA